MAFVLEEIHISVAIAATAGAITLNPHLDRSARFQPRRSRDTRPSCRLSRRASGALFIAWFCRPRRLCISHPRRRTIGVAAIMPTQRRLQTLVPAVEGDLADVVLAEQCAQFVRHPFVADAATG